MGVPGTGSKEEKVLIWGAGGAVGSYAVQYAKSVSGSDCQSDDTKHRAETSSLTFARLGIQ
jgi:NADPH:quinone reductase-like Zn-dependent oxidoreductase